MYIHTLAFMRTPEFLISQTLQNLSLPDQRCEQFETGLTTPTNSNSYLETCDKQNATLYALMMSFLNPTLSFFIMKIINLRGELTDTSDKTKKTVAQAP